MSPSDHNTPPAGGESNKAPGPGPYPDDERNKDMRLTAEEAAVIGLSVAFDQVRREMQLRGDPPLSPQQFREAHPAKAVAVLEAFRAAVDGYQPPR